MGYSIEAKNKMLDYLGQETLKLLLLNDLGNPIPDYAELQQDKTIFWTPALNGVKTMSLDSIEFEVPAGTTVAGITINNSFVNVEYARYDFAEEDKEFYENDGLFSITQLSMDLNKV